MRPRRLPFVLLLALLAALLAPAAASAQIEILDRGIAPDPAAEGSQATLTVDVQVDKAPYTVDFTCCDALGAALQRQVLDAANPATQGLSGTHGFTFDVGPRAAPDAQRTITVRVTDATGAQSTKAITFQPPVEAVAPVPDTPSGASRLAACEKVVEFALVRARASTSCWQKFEAGANEAKAGGLEIDPGTTFYETRGSFALNGIPFPPAPGGTSYVLVEPSDGARGGQLGIDRTITVDLGPFNLLNAPVRFKLPAPGSDGRLAALTLPQGSLGGLPVSGSVEIRFQKLGDRYLTSFPVQILLPVPVRPFPGASGGQVTGETQISTEDGRRVSFDGGKILVDTAAVDNLPLKSLCLSFMSAGASVTFSACEPPELDGAPAVSCEPPSRDVSRFDGSALVELPTEKKPLVGAYAGVSGGRFAYAGAFGDNLQIPIVSGITLERVGLGVCVQPRVVVKLDGGLGFAGGIVRGNGSVTYSQQERGFFVEAAANLSAFDIPMGDGRLRIESNGTVEFDLNAQMRLAAGFLLVRGGVDGFVQPQPFLFNVNGRVSVCVDFRIATKCLGKASATVSNKGAGGCGKLGRRKRAPTFGAFFFWKKPSGGRRFGLGRGCGFQDRVRVSRPRQAGAGFTFPVAEDEPQYVAHIQGAGAAPKVRITSPSGTVIQSGPEAATTDDDDTFALIENPEAPETSLFLPGDATPGDWKVEALPGSTVTGVEFQGAEDKPTIARAKVRRRGRGDGERRIVDLTYSVRSGDRIAVDVIGKGYQQPIATKLRGRRCAKSVTLPDRSRAEIRCARVTFKPKFGYAGTRTIRATVVDDAGATIDEITVATFRAGAPRKPTKVPALRLVRRGASVIVVWGAARNNVIRYGAYARLSDGRRIGHNAPGTCFAWRIPRVARGTSVSVQIQAGRTDLEFGGKVKRTLKARASYAGPKALRKAPIPKACASL